MARFSMSMGKMKWKRAAPLRIPRNPQSAPMILDDRLADGQPHSHAVGLVVKNRSKTRSITSAGMPLPLSHNVNHDALSARRQAVRTVSRRGRGSESRIASKPLRIRFTTTCSIWMRSPRTEGNGSVNSKHTSAWAIRASMLHQPGHVADDRVKVHQRLHGLGLRDEPPQAANNLGRPVGLFAHLKECGRAALSDRLRGRNAAAACRPGRNWKWR